MERSSTSSGSFYQLPRNYKYVSFLGRGAFGEVIKCIKEDTKETVALKILHSLKIYNELTLLNFFKWKNLDKCNIVRFIDSCTLADNRVSLAFEMLDVTLADYIFKEKDLTPLDLHEVRSVVQQMATALNALKAVKVIHSDIKTDNIMLVDKGAQPLRLKLIDFGLAFPTCRARQGATHQVTQYRAPEIILGIPFSEAIDMWSLGVVMGLMVLCHKLFPGYNEYDVMQYIVDLVGVPPDHLLSAGKYSRKYFVETFSGHWRVKEPYKRCHSGTYYLDLDNVEKLPLENLKMVEVDEKKECIDLLKAMLRMDANERITPSQVLAHPFITRGSPHHSSDTSEVLGTASTLPPRRICVQPQTACGLSWDLESAWMFESCTSETFGSEPSLLGYILPQSPQSYGSLLDGSSKFYGLTAEASLPGHILPQSPQSYGSLLDGSSKFYGLTAEASLPGHILPQSPQSYGSLLDGSSKFYGLTAEASLPGCILSQSPQTYWRLSNGSNGLEILCPGHIIEVQPAPPECCLAWDEDSGQQSEVCELDWHKDLSENSPVAYLKEVKNDPSPPPFLPEDCNMEHEHTELPATGSGRKCSAPPVSELPEKKEKDKKKKKNCLKRFCSWMRRTFGCCNRIKPK